MPTCLSSQVIIIIIISTTLYKTSAQKKPNPVHGPTHTLFSNEINVFTLSHTLTQRGHVT